MLRQYYSIYKPKYYLFESNTPGIGYSEKRLQSVLKQALQKKNIKSQLHCIGCGTATPPICLKVVQICDIYKNY